MRSRALYVGRLRIFHKGYIDTVKHILDQGHSELVIAIRAAQQSLCPDNPVSGEETAKMVLSALKEEGLNQSVPLRQ